MRKILLFALIMIPSGIAIAQDQKAKPLNEPEKRLVLLQLMELESARAKVSAYEDWIKREQALYEREKSVWQQSIETERRATEVAKQERDLAQEKYLFYKSLYETVTKKRGGIGCTLAKIFTLWTYRCK